jgi:hypothetical protein
LRLRKGQFLGLRIDDRATVTAPTMPQRRIEVDLDYEVERAYISVLRRLQFIGDSITCGYGNEVDATPFSLFLLSSRIRIVMQKEKEQSVTFDQGTPPCPFSPSTEDNWQTYGPMTATALQGLSRRSDKYYIVISDSYAFLQPSITSKRTVEWGWSAITGTRTSLLSYRFRRSGTGPCAPSQLCT